MLIYEIKLANFYIAYFLLDERIDELFGEEEKPMGRGGERERKREAMAWREARSAG
jgi:hypothetical protein